MSIVSRDKGLFTISVMFSPKALGLVDCSQSEQRDVARMLGHQVEHEVLGAIFVRRGNEVVLKDAE